MCQPEVDQLYIYIYIYLLYLLISAILNNEGDKTPNRPCYNLWQFELVTISKGHIQQAFLTDIIIHNQSLSKQIAVIFYKENDS